MVGELRRAQHKAMRKTEKNKGGNDTLCDIDLRPEDDFGILAVSVLHDSNQWHLDVLRAPVNVQNDAVVIVAVSYVQYVVIVAIWNPCTHLPHGQNHCRLRERGGAIKEHKGSSSLSVSHSSLLASLWANKYPCESLLSRFFSHRRD